jgi:hypothetical protein
VFDHPQTPPPPPPGPDEERSEAEICRRRAAEARVLASKATTAEAREALGVVAANWASLARHMARLERRRAYGDAGPEPAGADADEED